MQQTAREKDASCLEGGEEHVTEATSSKQINNGGGGGGGSGAGSVRWYERAYDYWEDGENCGLDDDGVLGGYGHISPVDINGSAAFLDELQSKRPLLGNEKAAGKIQLHNRVGHSNTISSFTYILSLRRHVSHVSLE